MKVDNASRSDRKVKNKTLRMVLIVEPSLNQTHGNIKRLFAARNFISITQTVIIHQQIHQLCTRPLICALHNVSRQAKIVSKSYEIEYHVSIYNTHNAIWSVDPFHENCLLHHLHKRRIKNCTFWFELTFNYKIYKLPVSNWLTENFIERFYDAEKEI